MPKNDPNQTKLFGPKKGLNRAESPFKRSLPSGPNAGAEEFATDFKNFYIDPKDGIMKVRPGFADINKGISAAQIGELGISRFNNYDENGEAQPVLLCLGRDNSYIVKKARVGISASSGGHKLTVLYHPTTSKYEVVHTNAFSGAVIDRLSLGNVNISALSTALTDLTISLTDLYTGQVYDGSQQLSNVFPIVDLEITVGSINEIHFDIVETIPSCVDLSDAKLDNFASRVAVFSEINNVLYIALGGLPLLKYDGTCIAKVGLPDPDVVAKSDLILGNGIGLDDAELESNPLWARTTGATEFALTLAQAPDNEILKGTDAFYKVVPNTSADDYLQRTLYALAYQKGGVISSAIGSEDGEQKIYATVADNSSSDYIDKTISSGTQNLSPLGDDTKIVKRVTTKSLPQGNGWEVYGAEVNDQGWVFNGDGDSSYGATNLTISVAQHNFLDLHKGEKIYFTMRLVRRNRNPTFASYKHQQYLVQAELIDFTSTTLVVSKELKLYNQPAGLEGVPEEANYNNLNLAKVNGGVYAVNPSTFTDAIGVMIYGAASLETLINIYESADVDQDVGQGYTEDAHPAGSFNLVAQIPNDPFGNDQVFYNWYDRNAYGDLYDSVNRVGETNRSTDSLLEHSSLPKGKIITSHKGRIYITQDPEAINTVYGTSLVYGPEKYDVSGDESFEIKDDIGDFITGLAPLGSALAVLKSNSAHVIEGDFASNNLRRDVIVSEGFGCTSHHSISQVKDGLAYLSEEGVVYWQFGSKPQMMGSVYLNREAGSEPMSRIRGFLADKKLDLTRAISFNDFKKELYILYIPRNIEKSKGLFGTNQDGLTLVYDYMRDMWFEYTNYEFRGGCEYVNGTLYRANTRGNGVTLNNPRIYREWQTETLFDFHDDFSPINWSYGSDWDSFNEPSIDKKPMHIKLFGYNLFKDINIPHSSIDLNLRGEFSVLVEMHKDFRDYSLHTKNSLKISDRQLENRIKCSSQKVVSAKVSISNVIGEIFKCPCIMGIEVEYQIAHRGFQKPSGSS